MNLNVMLLHMFSFLFYILSGISYYIALVNFYRHFSDSSTKAQVRAMIIDNVVVGCTFLAQLCQIFILNKLTLKREEIVADLARHRTFTPGEMIETDAEFENATKVVEDFKFSSDTSSSINEMLSSKEGAALESVITAGSTLDKDKTVKGFVKSLGNPVSEFDSKKDEEFATTGSIP